MAASMNERNAAREALLLRESEPVFVHLMSNASPGGTLAQFTNELAVPLKFPAGHRVQVYLHSLTADLIPGGLHNYIVHCDIAEWGQRAGNGLTTMIAAVTLQDGVNNWQATLPQWVNTSGADGCSRITLAIYDYNDALAGSLQTHVGATLGFRVVRA
jgi:hypothetical protein